MKTHPLQGALAGWAGGEYAIGRLGLALALFLASLIAGCWWEFRR